MSIPLYGIHLANKCGELQLMSFLLNQNFAPKIYEGLSIFVHLGLKNEKCRNNSLLGPTSATTNFISNQIFGTILNRKRDIKIEGECFPKDNPNLGGRVPKLHAAQHHFVILPAHRHNHLHKKITFTKS
jgi:hypothetical protein